MSTKQYLSFSLLIATILLSVANAGRVNMPLLCSHIDYPELCNTVMKTVHGGVLAALKANLQASVTHATQAKASVEKLLPSADPDTKDSLQTCKDNYDSAIDDLQKALAAIDIKDFYTMKTNIDASFTDITTCDEAFGGDDPESGPTDSPVAKITTTLNQYAKNNFALSDRVLKDNNIPVSD